MSQINKKKHENNSNLIDTHTNDIKAINSSITDIKNDINNICTPVINQKYVLDKYIYLILILKKNLILNQILKNY